MAQASGALRVGQSGERVAYGEFMPSLTFNSAAYQSGQRDLITSIPAVPSTLIPYPPQSYSANLSASFDVFTGGRRTADVAAARATTRSADASLVQQRYAVALVAKQAYYAERRARELVQVSLAAVATAERALQYAESRMQRGTATRADVLLAQLNATTARQQLIAARDTLTTNAYALGRLVGVAGAVAAAGADSLPNVALSMPDSAIIDLAVRSAPAVRAADEFARASDAEVHSAQTQYVPDIKLTGGYNWANNSIAYSASRPGWVVQLGTSYPLFNGFVREDDVTRASAAAHTARVTATDEHRFTRAEAERLLADVRFAWQNIGESQEAVRVGSENLRVVSVRYQNGVATFLDLSTAQVDEAQAEIGLVTARYNYQIARASLEALVGRDL
jgi:outer membrane protein TolC